MFLVLNFNRLLRLPLRHCQPLVPSGQRASSPLHVDTNGYHRRNFLGVQLQLAQLYFSSLRRLKDV